MREEECRTEIRRYDRPGLIDLWEKIQRREQGGPWPPGKCFAYLVLRAFELEEADIVWPFPVSLPALVGSASAPNVLAEQIDGVVFAEGIPYLFESKDEDNAINIEPIAKLRIRLSRRPATAVGVLFTSCMNEGFTLPARTLTTFMGPPTILLWSGAEVDHALREGLMRKGLRWKYRIAVQHGVPDYNIKLGSF